MGNQDVRPAVHLLGGLIVALLLAFLIPNSSEAKNSKPWQDRYCEGMELEHRLPDGGRVDCLSAGLSGFVTSALQAGADVLRVMDVTRHRQINTLKVYDRRARAFKQHAGESFL